MKLWKPAAAILLLSVLSSTAEQRAAAKARISHWNVVLWPLTIFLWGLIILSLFV